MCFKVCLFLESDWSGLDVNSEAWISIFFTFLKVYYLVYPHLENVNSTIGSCESMFGNQFSTNGYVNSETNFLLWKF